MKTTIKVKDLSVNPLLGTLFPEEIVLELKENDKVEVVTEYDTVAVSILREGCPVDGLKEIIENHPKLSLAEDLEEGEIFFCAEEGYEIARVLIEN